MAMRHEERTRHQAVRGLKSRAGKGRAQRGVRSKPWWPWLKHGAIVTFVLVVVVLLVRQASAIDWVEVFDTIAHYPPPLLWGAAGVAACGHLLYSCFDLLGRHYTGHRLARWKVMLVTFVSYAFNLNFGAIVGGMAMRLRLYSRFGLDTPTVARVTVLSMWTNWLGYLFLAGSLFLWMPLALPPQWPVGAGVLRLTGCVLLAAALGYLLLCARSRRRSWLVKGHDVVLPSIPLVLAQIAIGSANWMLIAGIIDVLLGGRVPYPVVLGTYLVGVVAGIITRVPGGLGVLEAVFIALRSPRVPSDHILAALLTYRAMYYWGPLVLAGICYLALEVRAKMAKPLASPHSDAAAQVNARRGHTMRRTAHGAGT